MMAESYEDTFKTELFKSMKFVEKCYFQNMHISQCEKVLKQQQLIAEQRADMETICKCISVRSMPIY